MVHNIGKESHHGTYVYHMPEFVYPKYRSHLFIIYIFKWSVWATRKIQPIKSLEKKLKYRFDIPGHDKSTVGRKGIDSENSNCGLIYGGKRNRCVIFPAKQHLSHSTHPPIYA